MNAYTFWIFRKCLFEIWMFSSNRKNENCFNFSCWQAFIGIWWQVPIECRTYWALKSEIMPEIWHPMKIFCSSTLSIFIGNETPLTWLAKSASLSLLARTLGGKYWVMLSSDPLSISTLLSTAALSCTPSTQCSVKQIVAHWVLLEQDNDWPGTSALWYTAPHHAHYGQLSQYLQLGLDHLQKCSY